MPKRNTQPKTSATPSQTQSSTEKKWAEPYRPLVTNAVAGFELGENKIANLFIFSFAQDPGPEIKGKLKKFGYLYDGRQKTWSANVTPLTREIARRLADEFASGLGAGRDGAGPTK